MHIISKRFESVFYGREIGQKRFRFFGFMILSNDPKSKIKSPATISNDGMISTFQFSEMDADMHTDTSWEHIMKNPNIPYTSRVKNIPHIIVNEFDVMNFFLEKSLNGDVAIQYSVNSTLRAGLNSDDHDGIASISFSDITDMTFFKLSFPGNIR